MNLIASTKVVKMGVVMITVIIAGVAVVMIVLSKLFVRPRNEPKSQHVSSTNPMVVLTLEDS